jgi:anti-anti-sigma regulatory factor
MGVRMTSTLINIDPERVASALNQDAAGKLTTAEELILDFSFVPRIDSNALRALEDLAHSASERSVKIALQSVNLAIYKALKLAKLAQRFSFR